MITGKYVSLNYIVERLFDLGIAPQFIDLITVKEKIHDVLSLMAVPSLFVSTSAEITIVDFKGALPCNYHSLEDGGVFDSLTGTPLVYKTNVYHGLPVTTAASTLSGYTMGAEIAGAIAVSPDYFTYELSGGYIITGFETGSVVMAYTAIPLDSAGDPMVPDNERIIRGVVFGVAEPIAARMWMSDQLSTEKFNYISQQACWYMASGQNAAHIPNLDKMQSMSNMWSDPVLNGSQHDSGFSQLHLRPRIKTHTNRYRR